MRLRLLLVGMVGCLVGGCASVGVTRLGNDAYPAKPSNCNIQVFMDPKTVNRKYVEVCLIDSRTGSTLFDNKTVEGAIEAAKPKACEMGCDAIIVKNSDTEGVNLSGWGQGKAILEGVRFAEGN